MSTRIIARAAVVLGSLLPSAWAQHAGHVGGPASSANSSPAAPASTSPSPAATAASPSPAATTPAKPAPVVRSLAPKAPSPSSEGGNQYRSAFEGYRRFSDEPVKSWKEANDRVGQIGGWRTYAREASGDEGAGAHAGHGAVPAARAQTGSGQSPPRAGTASTDKPFGQTEMTNTPNPAPRPTSGVTPAAPPTSQPTAASDNNNRTQRPR